MSINNEYSSDLDSLCDSLVVFESDLFSFGIQ